MAFSAATKEEAKEECAVAGGKCKGSITIFLSLVSVLILSLVCTLLESARVQGVRAWASSVTDMGIFSVMGAYDRELLEDYEVLFLDGGYGTGDFEPERIALEMRNYMAYNITPSKGLVLDSGMNLFPMELESCTITGYQLATDQDGAAFYQQVVENQKENLGVALLERCLSDAKEAKKEEESASSYEEQDRQSSQELESLEQMQEEGQSTSDGEGSTSASTTAASSVENPLEAIKKVKAMGILGLVVKDPGEISTRTVVTGQLPSERQRKEGNLAVEEAEKGTLADGLFQDYLMEHFGTWTSPKTSETLAYQVEYLLRGRSGDRENLKAVVNRLLLLREGVNFVCAAADASMRSQAGVLAATLAGAAPLPGLTSAITAALLLAWAYGESLLEVRTLLSGGKVPIVKTAGNWKLSLENLAHVTELLDQCDSGQGSGQSYEDYLRLMLFTGQTEKYPLRALDLMESADTTGSARADGWVVKIQVETTWNFPSVFLRVPQRFLQLSGREMSYRVKGELSY
jgi:hypothetical protein